MVKIIMCPRMRPKSNSGLEILFQSKAPTTGQAGSVIQKARLFTNLAIKNYKF